MSERGDAPAVRSNPSGFQTGFRNAVWLQSPLGPPEGWPLPLHTLAELALDSTTPTFIAWGPELCLLYNEPYAEILGDRHPAALGQPLPRVWPEIWHEIRPLITQCLAGEALHFEDRRFVIRRNGREQEAWFSFSYTPIRDASRAVAGIYCALIETTRQVLARRERNALPDRLRQLFHQAPGFMAVTTGEDHVVELVNEACMQLIGRQEVIGKPLRDAVPELADQVYLELFNQVYRTGEAFTGQGMQVYFQPPGESAPDLRYVDFVFQPIIDADGRVTGVFVQGIDVTDHQRVEEELRRSEAVALKLASQTEMHARRLDAVLDAAPVGILYADADGRLEVVNAAVRQTWGEHPSTGIGHHRHWKAWWADGSDRHGQPVQPDEWPLDRALGGEEDARAIIEIEPFDHPGVRRTVQLQAKPVRNSEGMIVGAVVAEMDITDQVEVQARLRESEAKFRTITNAMPQIVWSTLPDGHHDYYNRRWYDFTGMSEGAADGDVWDALLHPDDRAKALEAWRNSLATGEPYEIQYRLRHHSGEYRWVLGRALPVRSEQGLIVRWMGTCTDIHEQVVAQEMLEDASRRKDEFLAMLAHELRNPLAPISTAASVLGAAANDPNGVRQLSEVIQRQTRHLTKMVDDLLDVSRVTRGLAKLEFEIIDLKAVARSAIEQVRPLIEDRGHELTTWAPSGEVLVHGDRVRLVQVVTNLLNNAARYTRRGGKIELMLGTGEGEAILEVRDNGSGIDPELLPRVFDLFTQGTRSPDRHEGGLGIGLALARSIVGLHGGRITASSMGRGQGSQFAVTLPLAKLKASPAASREHTSLVQPAAHALNVMVVDDNVDAARTIALLLELQGHDVRMHHDGASALEDSATNPADLYILDIGLPDIPGYELARRLRQEAHTMGSKLVALTGYGRSEDRALSQEAGFDLHLVKPVDAEQLLQAVAAVTGH